MKYIWHLQYILSCLCFIAIIIWFQWLRTRRHEWPGMLTIKFITYLIIFIFITILYDILCIPKIWNGILSKNLFSEHLHIFILVWIWVGCLWILWQGLAIYFISKDSDRFVKPQRILNSVLLISSTNVIACIIGILQFVYIGNWGLFESIILLLGDIILSIMFALVTYLMLEIDINKRFNRSFVYKNLAHRLKLATWILFITTALCCIGVLLINIYLTPPRDVILKVVLALLLFTIPCAYFIRAFTKSISYPVKALNESEDRFRDIACSIADWIWELDLNNIYTYCSDNVSNIIGYMPDEIIGKNIFDFMPLEEVKRIKSINPEIFFQNKPIKDLEHWIISKHNKRIYLTTSVVPILNGNGEIVGYRCVSKNITDRKQAEEKLAKTLREQENIMDAAPDIIYMTDLNGGLLRWNKKLESATGFSDDELSIMKIKKYMPREEWPIIKKAKIEVLEKGICETEAHIINRDGTLVPYQFKLTSLKDNQGKIIGFTGIARDITDRRQAEKELLKAKEQAEAASRAKSQFLTNMSHEIRTPLNSIIALSRVIIMQGSNKLSNEETSYLEIIERNGKNLLNLINNILDLSKIESGKTEININPFSIQSTIKIIIESLETLAEARSIKINLNINKDIPYILSDEIKVQQILQNIIGNAIKFTEKGSITINAYNDEQNIYIETIDTGIGMCENDIPHIFEEFCQVDGSSTRNYQGTGLGLAIAYKTAKNINGDIKVESIKGKGSKFILVIPILWQNEILQKTE